MIGQISIWTVLVTGILLLVIWLKVKSYENDKKSKERTKGKDEQ